MGLPAGGVLSIRLGDDLDGIASMNLARSGDLVWSITDNGLAKASSLDVYPLQERYGKGVINIRLPADAEEEVAAVVDKADGLIIVTTAQGTTATVAIDEAHIGSRSIKPRPVVKVGPRNRITGVVRVSGRPERAGRPAR